MANNYMEYYVVFKALCDENRIKILKMLQESEKSSVYLLQNLTVSKSTFLYHMKILVKSGIVSSYDVEKKKYYVLSRIGIRHAENLLSEIMERKLP